MFLMLLSVQREALASSGLMSNVLRLAMLEKVRGAAIRRGARLARAKAVRATDMPAWRRESRELVKTIGWRSMKELRLAGELRKAWRRFKPNPIDLVF
jgi:hypothetical protein